MDSQDVLGVVNVHVDTAVMYNNAWHPSIGCSPAEMMYGQRMLNVHTARVVSKNPSAMKFAGDWHKRCERAKSPSHAAQQRQAKYFNKRRTVEDDKLFQEGAKVLVDTRNIRLLAKIKDNKETRRVNSFHGSWDRL